jgi:hypothetical protein
MSDKFQIFFNGEYFGFFLYFFLNTASPGTALTSPERSSEIRLLAIAAHFLSMSESGGFGLLLHLHKYLN